MGLVSIVGWILFGLIVGALARFILPGRQEMGIIMTILLGIAGSFAGGFISSLVMGGEPGLQPSTFIWSLLGALILLVLYSWLKAKRTSP